MKVSSKAINKGQYKVTCRYGVEYNIKLIGSKGACARTVDMLSKCCCFVCHNHDCQSPHDEKIECSNECKFYFKSKPCENK